MPDVVSLRRIGDRDRRGDCFARGRENQVKSVADVVGFGMPSRQSRAHDPFVRPHDLHDPAIAALGEHPRVAREVHKEVCGGSGHGGILVLLSGRAKGGSGGYAGVGSPAADISSTISEYVRFSSWRGRRPRS